MRECFGLADLSVCSDGSDVSYNLSADQFRRCSKVHVELKITDVFLDIIDFPNPRGLETCFPSRCRLLSRDDVGVAFVVRQEFRQVYDGVGHVRPAEYHNNVFFPFAIDVVILNLVQASSTARVGWRSVFSMNGSHQVSPDKDAKARKHDRV